MSFVFKIHGCFFIFFIYIHIYYWFMFGYLSLTMKACFTSEVLMVLMQCIFFHNDVYFQEGDTTAAEKRS